MDKTQSREDCNPGSTPGQVKCLKTKSKFIHFGKFRYKIGVLLLK